MKKKVLSLCMAAALVLGSGTAAMAADTLESNGASTSKDVTGKYEPMAEAETSYKVELQWGSMAFTYHAPDTVKKWDPKAHEYVEEKGPNGEWRYEDGANKITITNSSNKAITATINAVMTENGITATVKNPKIDLEDASIGATTEVAGTASTRSSDISLEGELTNKNANKAIIGTVTISFEDTVTEQP